MPSTAFLPIFSFPHFSPMNNKIDWTALLVRSCIAIAVLAVGRATGVGQEVTSVSAVTASPPARPQLG